MSRNVCGIKEIAESLHVSIGTVDRALHSRPGINALTRARVLKMAETMGYRPNLAARFLKSRKQLTFSVHLPLQIASFFDALRAGIAEAATPFEPAVQVDFRSYPRLGSGDAELFEAALEDGASGLVIAPGEPSTVKPLIRKAARRNVPVVCVATDAPRTERLTSISACPYTNGRIAGELICRVARAAGELAFVTGSLATEDHEQKLEGFRSSVTGFCRDPLDIRFVLEARDDEQLAYEQTRRMLSQTSELRGIYVSTSNSLPVLQAIQESPYAGEVVVITTDLFDELIPLIRSGQVLATVHQRPMTQGRLAFLALYQFLVEGKCPSQKIRIAPHIVMSSNLDVFLDRVPGVRGEMALS